MFFKLPQGLEAPEGPAMPVSDPETPQGLANAPFCGKESFCRDTVRFFKMQILFSWI